MAGGQTWVVGDAVSRGGRCISLLAMYEFDSLSVSTYEASSLASKLTEKSGDGWEVVAIVPTGSDVTAYLKRQGGGDADAGVGAPSGEASSTTSAAAGDDAAASGSTSEPAGWGTAPESTSGASSWGTSSTADSGSSWGSSGGDAASTGGTSGTTAAGDTTASWGTGAAEGSSWGSGASGASDSSGGSGGWGGGASAGGAPAAPAAQTAPSVPPGWYADPAGRYELRYWDGSAWTEHVSRAGQQYTDPPVA